MYQRYIGDIFVWYFLFLVQIWFQTRWFIMGYCQDIRVSLETDLAIKFISTYFFNLFFYKNCSENYTYIKTVLSNHFVSLETVCWWEENICKQIEIPYHYKKICFQYPLLNYLSFKPFIPTSIITIWLGSLSEVQNLHCKEVSTH